MAEHDEPRVARTIVAFLVVGALLLGAVSVAGFFAIRAVATRQALDEAKDLTTAAARRVERRVQPGLITGDAVAVGLIERVVRDAILIDPIVRVKLWAPDGTVIYSDETAQIGQRFESGEEELEELAPGEVVAELSDLTSPEHEAERRYGELLEVYTSFTAPDGTRILFETYQLPSSVDAAEREILAAFVPVLIVALVAFAALMLPLAWSLARRLQRGAADRERLLRRAVDASELERRRIADDLHDGPVQALAGLSMRLAAVAEHATEPAHRSALADAAGAVRGGVRSLRAAIVGIDPATLESAGLGPSLADLAAPLGQEGLAVSVDVAEPAGYGAEVDELLYRTCREALTNVRRHARASSVSVAVRRDPGRVIMEVTDDGVGLAAGADRADEGPDGGHLGLRIARDLVRQAGGTVEVGPAAAAGTVFRVEVPVP